MQTANSDSEAIRQAVSDYYEGWYRADVGKMDRSLHAELAKRAIKRDEHGREYLHHLTKRMMVDYTRDGGGSRTPPEKRHWTITILDQYEEIAVVKVNSGEYTEYLQLARQDDRWLILNVLYTNTR